jgi:hypothetical protein
MKKLLIGLILGLVLVGVFVSATMSRQSEGSYHVSINLHKGWNLVAGTIPEEGILPNSEIKLSDISVVWYYSPIQKKYFQVHPNIDDDMENDNDDYVLSNAMWVYSDKSGLFKYSTLGDYRHFVAEEEYSANKFKLYGGWNFIVITPEIVGSKLADIEGSCNVQTSCGWDNRGSEGEWDCNDGVNVMLPNSAGLGIAVKVSSDCTMGSSTTSPPTLPGGSDQPSDLGDVLIDYPQEISEYSFKEIRQDSLDCGYIDGVEVCVKSARLEYEQGDKMVHVLPSLITKGKDAYIDYVKASSTEQVASGVYRLAEEWELAWFPEDYGILVTQEYDSGVTRADVNNPVTQYFLNQYPSTNTNLGCLEAVSKIWIQSGAYTYSDSSSEKLSLQITRGDVDVELSGIQVIIEVNGTSYIETLVNNLPGSNEQKVYVLDDSQRNYGFATKVEIAPIITEGVVEKICDISSAVDL